MSNPRSESRQAPAHFDLRRTWASAALATAWLLPPIPHWRSTLLVDGDECLKRLGSVPPAELRAGDDPGVLVEPVAHVRAGLRAVVDPALELECAGRQRDLVERLPGRAGERERGRARALP